MKKRISILIVLCLGASMSFVGCKMTGEITPTSTVQTGLVTEEDTTTTTEQQIEQQETVFVYVGNGNADGFLVETEPVGEVTGETVFQALQKQGVIAETVQYQSFQQEEDNGTSLLKLDLSKEFQEEMSKMGTAGEYLTIQGIANTYLTAFHGDSIQITADGNTIETGHTIYKEPLQLDISMPDHMEAMTSIFDSLMRCIMENQTEYNPEDDAFYWNAIYYAVGAYGDLHGLCEVKDNELSAPKQVVAEYATALFYDFRDLPDIPEQNKNNIRYVDEEENYYFTLGDIGLSNTRIIQCEAGEEEGTYVIYAQLYDVVDKETIGTYRFVVRPNAYVDGITDPVFYYSVDSVEKIK